MKPPLISIVCTVKNNLNGIKDCIDSFLNQDYPYKQIIVQDGASTDGTLEFLQTKIGPIELVSYADQNAEEGWKRALSRVKGDIFIPCDSHQVLKPNALSWAAQIFKNYPDIAAIYGDFEEYDLSDHSKQLFKSRNFFLEAFISGDMEIPLHSTFFKTQACNHVQIKNFSLCGGFELFLKLGMNFSLVYEPSIISQRIRHTPSEKSYLKEIQYKAQQKVEVINAIFSQNPYQNHAEFIKLQQISSGAIYFNSIKNMSIDLLDPESLSQTLTVLELLENGLKYTQETEYKSNAAIKLAQYSLFLFQHDKFEQSLMVLEKLEDLNIQVLGMHHVRSLLLQRLGRIKEAQQADGMEEARLMPGSMCMPQ
ncbi:MAG: hypothetical protein K0S74_929 [Chlamydiales bacterium]|jgi:glycosyltransferase involved in cell wall biosynthesis|nr:hypothetical protein [Chlamydiales bacterium]